MHAKRVAAVVLLAFVALSAAFVVWQRTSSSADAPAAPTIPASVQAPQVTVYYFHAKARCATCQRLEAYAREAVESGFAAELAAGRLAFSSLDVTELQYRHFGADFQLQFQSVVLGESRDGQMLRWKKLDRIWDLVRDKPAYVTYVQNELRAFLEAKG
jgi:hypothetical protein